MTGLCFDPFPSDHSDHVQYIIFILSEVGQVIPATRLFYFFFQIFAWLMTTSIWLPQILKENLDFALKKSIIYINCTNYKVMMAMYMGWFNFYFVEMWLKIWNGEFCSVAVEILDHVQMWMETYNHCQLFNNDVELIFRILPATDQRPETDELISRGLSFLALINIPRLPLCTIIDFRI